MRRLRYGLLAVALVTVLWLGTATGAHADKSYRAERFEVTIEVLPNGDLRVAETVAFVFKGGPFTYVFRDIRSRNSEGIYELSVTEMGRAAEEQVIRQFSVDRGDDVVKVRWEFEPTYDQVRTFSLSYVARQATRIDPDMDQVYWNAIPADHDYEIGSSLIQVRVPTSISRAEGQGDGLIGTFAGQEATFRTGHLGRNRGVTVRVLFPHGALATEPPLWQAAEAAREGATAQFIGIAGVLLVSGICGVAFLVRSRGRDRVESPGTVIAPPDDLPVWKAAALLQGEASGSHVAAAIIGLGQRGVLSLREVEEERRHIFGRRIERDYLLTLEGESGELSPFEVLLLESLFAESEYEPPSILISEASTDMGRYWSDLRKAIQSELKADGLVEPKPLRTSLFAAAGLLMVLGIAGIPLVALTWASQWGGAVLAVPVSIFLVGCAALVGGMFVSQRSLRGAEHAARWRAFRIYLKQVVKGSSLPVSVDWFDPYMPSVVAFGLEKGWGRRFAERDVPLPIWFIPGGMGDATAALRATAAIGSISASVGGAVAGGGAAAGAGGGGASGAGEEPGRTPARNMPG